MKKLDSKKFTPHLRRVVAVSLMLLLSTFTLSAQINVSFNGVKVSEAIKYIQQNYDYSFVMNTDDVEITKIVSVKGSNASIESILDQIFIDQAVKHTVEGQMIYVSYDKRKAQKVIRRTSLNGRIVDSEGAPILGATVIESSTNNGVTTDVNGEFNLKTTTPSPTVTIGYIGFVSQTISVPDSQSTLNVTLLSDVLAVDEVVVVGYGTMVRSDITSAISSYKPKDSEQMGAISVDKLLQGHVSGVSISSTSGTPGSATKVNIRGIGSLTAGNDPLYVVDGIPLTSTSGDTGTWSGIGTSGLSAINPADIASVEILKDAASAAIYGSRATNGVVVITTKKGRKGEAVINFDASMSFSELTRTDNIKVADADLMIEVFNEAIDNYNMQTGSSVARYSNPAPDEPYHNWIDYVTRTGVSYKGNLSISGGTDDLTYYVSGGYNHTEGVIIENELNQYNFKVNLTSEIKPWATFGFTTGLSYTNNNRIPDGYTGYNPIKAAVEEYPWHSPYTPNGDWASSENNLLINHNPVQNIMEQDVFADNYRATSSVFFDFKLMKDLKFKTSFGEDFQYIVENIYYTSENDAALPSDENPSGGMLIDGRRTRFSLLWDNTLTYDKKLGDFNLQAMLGSSLQTYDSSSSEQTGYSFPSSSFTVNTSATTFQDVWSATSAYALLSYFGRLNTNYKDRYVATLTMRTDGSSKFAPQNRWGYFPSASAGWNMNEENWWQAPDTAVKLRASWGVTGNQDGIGAYAYQALAYGGYNYNGLTGIGMSAQGNEDLRWEQAVQYNLGADLSFLRGAITFSADVFQKDTYDLLYSKPTMVTTGFTTQISNIGTMSNKGLELSLTGRAGKGDFKWSGSFNISFIRNELTSLLGDEEVISTNSVQALQVGQEAGAYYIVKFLGIYQYDSEVPETLYAEGVRAGDCIYEDVNDDGYIDSEDYQFVGSPNPDFSGGFSSTFSYKGLELGMHFTYSYGNQMYELLTGGLRLGNGVWPLQESACLSRWTGPGTTNETPRAIYGYTWNSTRFVNSRFLHDASYIRCSAMTLGYNLPDKLLKKINISALKVYAQADNLFVITKWPYLDPEVSASTNSISGGYDWFNVSQPRTISFGVSAKF
ncbi:MAG: TonB-dependent receptor [Rikenellaceae bacterium]